MNGEAAIALLPLFALVAALLVVLLAGAFYPRHRALWTVALAGQLAALTSLPFIARRIPLQATVMLTYDAPVLFFTTLILMAGLAVTVASFPYLARRPVHGGLHHREYYLLLLLALTGALLLLASRHFAALFLGLEILSVSLFGLIAYRAQEARALEAGIKYLLLSGASSALLLFGLALIYAATGSLAFGAPVPAEGVDLARAGMLLVVTGFGFKLSLVPFHMWTPDVYEGAPTPVTALLAAVVKGSVAATLWLWLSHTPLAGDRGLMLALGVLAVLSMLVGNVLALFQQNLKRLLAYSSIGHMGFWLVPLAAAGPVAAEAAGYYLAAYVAAVLAAFLTIGHLSSWGDEEVTAIASYRGLFWHQPLAAVVLTVAMLSLAGIPLTMGFIAKFYIFAAGVEGARWGLVAAVALASAIGIYYYLRVITVLFAPEHAVLRVPGSASGVLLLLLLIIVLYGVLPAPLVDAVRAAVR